jgi:hypothetical protein
VTLHRVALAFTVSGLVLAGIAVLADRRPVTWVAIGFLAVAFVLRRVARRRGSP